MKSFRRNILNFVGIKPVESTLIGNVEGDAETRAEWLDKMFELGSAGA